MVCFELDLIRAAEDGGSPVVALNIQYIILAIKIEINTNGNFISKEFKLNEFKVGKISYSIFYAEYRIYIIEKHKSYLNWRLYWRE